jgi:hypothetical protein
MSAHRGSSRDRHARDPAIPTVESRTSCSSRRSSVVGSGELVRKPIALVNASGRAKHAWASLAETLIVMSALVIRDASITVSLEGRTLDADGIVGDAQRSRALRSAIEALAGAARDARRR